MNWIKKLKFKFLNVNYIYFTMNVSNSHLQQGYRTVLKYYKEEVCKKGTDI